MNPEEEINKRMVASIAGAMLYLVSPLDVVPDWVPFGGLLDDALVLAYHPSAQREPRSGRYAVCDLRALTERPRCLHDLGWTTEVKRNPSPIVMQICYNIPRFVGNRRAI